MLYICHNVLDRYGLSLLAGQALREGPNQRKAVLQQLWEFRILKQGERNLASST